VGGARDAGRDRVGLTRVLGTEVLIGVSFALV
jgi:hypothetical protein